jgi:hypothetical protein
MHSESIEILYDHYKDTFQTIQKVIAEREKNFILAFLLVATSFLLTLNPDIGLDLVKDIGKEKFKIDMSPTYYAMNSVVLFAAIWFWIRYFQNVLLIENLYVYIHKLEENLSSIGEVEISREGKNYLKYYPVLKSLIHKFYTILVPFLLVIVIFAKGYYEWFVENGNIPLIPRVVDSVGMLFLFASTVLYLSWVHFHDFKK